MESSVFLATTATITAFLLLFQRRILCASLKKPLHLIDASPSSDCPESCFSQKNLAAEQVSCAMHMSLSQYMQHFELIGTALIPGPV